MYVARQHSGDQLGDIKSFIKKARAIVHKAFPRELSPTRMIEKWSDEQKKKQKAALAKQKAATAAANQAQLDAVKKAGAQLATLQQFAPGVDGAAGVQALASPGAAGSDAPAASDGSLDPVTLAALVGAGIFGVYLLTRKRK